MPLIAPRWTPAPRSRAFGRRRIFRIPLLLLAIWAFLDILSVRINTREAPRPKQNTEKIFISALAWDSEKALRGFWSNALLTLTKQLGPDNVYVSIAESGTSRDDTRGALSELGVDLSNLGVVNNIAFYKGDPEEVQDDSSGAGQRTIPYLAKLRNLSLKPLLKLAKRGMKFDKILFLSDVVFTVCSAYSKTWDLIHVHISD